MYAALRITHQEALLNNLVVREEEPDALPLHTGLREHGLWRRLSGTLFITSTVQAAIRSEVQQKHTHCLTATNAAHQSLAATKCWGFYYSTRSYSHLQISLEVVQAVAFAYHDRGRGELSHVHG